MRKRNYILTPDSYGYKVEAWDDYGKYVCVYEKTREQASDFVIKWWEMSEENKKSDELMSNAIKNMIELEKKSGLHFTDGRGNHRDGLD
jgi:hypothetical protein